MKKILALITILIPMHSYAECIGRPIIDGELRINVDEYAYIVNSFGDEYKNHDKEKMDKLKVSDFKKWAEKTITGYDKIFTLPVQKTIKGPEVKLLTLTQTIGDSIGIKDGQTYKIVINRRTPYFFSTCNVFKVN
jgi:hypothetical protein